MTLASKVKTIAFGVKATESHNAVKQRSVLKWLKSGHKVKVTITGKPEQTKSIENIFEDLHKSIQIGAKLENKAIKPGRLSCMFTPTENADQIEIIK